MGILFSDFLTKKTPDSWSWCRLGECLYIVRNGLSIEQNQEGKGVKVTRIETISGGVVNIEKVGFVDTVGDISEYILRKGDVLFSHINSVKHIGKVAQIINDEELYHGMNLLLLRFNNKVEKRFGYYFLASRQTKSVCERMAKQAVNQASINTKEIRQLPILLPPLLEQRKIAEILSIVDEAIEKTDAIIQQAQQLKKGLMKKLFTEGIGHTRFKDTKIGRIPEEWEVIRLIEHISLPTGQVDPKDAVYTDLPLIAPDHIESETGRLLTKMSVTSQNAISGKYIFSPGTVLYGKIRPHLRKAVLVDFCGLCSADMYPLRPVVTINPRYLLAIILSDNFSSFAESRSMRTGIPKLNRKELGEYHCALPPLPEQRKIAEILSEFDAQIETEQAYKAELEQLKKGLMQVLLTGKVRVKV